MNFEEIKKQAMSLWEAMQNSSKPRILIGTGTCGIAAGAGTRGEGTLDGIPRLFDLPVLKPQVRIALRNCGNIDPMDTHQYIANGGYEGLGEVLKMKPQEIIDEIKKSGLRGRGEDYLPPSSP